LLTRPTCAIPPSCPLHVDQRCRVSRTFTVWAQKYSFESKYWVSCHMDAPQRPNFADMAKLRHTSGMHAPCRSELQSFTDVHRLGRGILVRIQLLVLNSHHPHITPEVRCIGPPVPFRRDARSMSIRSVHFQGRSLSGSRYTCPNLIIGFQFT